MKLIKSVLRPPTSFTTKQLVASLTSQRSSSLQNVFELRDTR
nr:MAG TPA: hypothetical protein [Caudoviricetes sp.]